MAVKFKKTFKWFAMLMVLALIAIYCFFELGGYLITTKQERREWIQSIRSAPPLPEKFTQLYSTLHPDYLNNGYWDNIFKGLLNSDDRSCACEKASINNLAKRSHAHPITVALTTFLIKDNVTEKECFAYHASVLQFQHNCTGIESLCNYYFHKKISDATEEEMLELIVMLDYPYYVDKDISPEAFNWELNAIKNKLKSQNTSKANKDANK
jgi:hypothetical protein